MVKIVSCPCCLSQREARSCDITRWYKTAVASVGQSPFLAWDGPPSAFQRIEKRPEFDFSTFTWAWCFFSTSRFVQFHSEIWTLAPWLTVYQTRLPAANICLYPVMPVFFEMILSEKRPESLRHRLHLSTLSSKDSSTKQLFRTIFTFKLLAAAFEKICNWHTV